MAISVIFSIVIYRVQSSEQARVLLRQRAMIEGRGFLRPGFTIEPEPEILEEARRRLVLNLILINLGVLVVSGGAAYFLAGRTLKPIEEAVEDQKRFVADASHELRTPLTTMKTELEVNLRGKGLEKEAKKILESNLEEVDKLSYLSDKLLHLSRYEQKEGLAFTSVSLKEVLEKAIEKHTSLAKSKKIEIVKNLEEANVQGDFAALVEAFGTIVDNAIKYSPKDSKVNVDLQGKDSKAVVKIQDFGVGIKSSELPHIFDRFYRADTSRTKEKVEGFGLGLSIAKAAIEKHNGKIEVESSPGIGTTFTIFLPR
jgi:signal transduction histidine kinase